MRVLPVAALLLPPPSHIGSTVDAFSRESGGVPVGVVGGPITLRVTVKQSDGGSGPKLDIDASLGMLHVLLSPHQLWLLQDMAQGIAAQGALCWCPVGHPSLPSLCVCACMCS